MLFLLLIRGLNQLPPDRGIDFETFEDTDVILQVAHKTAIDCGRRRFSRSRTVSVTCPFGPHRQRCDHTRSNIDSSNDVPVAVGKRICLYNSLPFFFRLSTLLWTSCWVKIFSPCC